ncbi:MAG: PAS domain-containing protein [Pseudomonadales bacterium]
MKQPIEPTNREVSLSEDEFIVSKTDTQSNIIYINRVFMQISGFSERELLHLPHSIIRHPDMPRAVFHLLWQEIKAGREFLGYVKNICKDGGFYWVLAHVTPDWDENGKVIAYYSVRRRPTRTAVKYMTELYAKMCAVEKASPKERACEHAIKLLNETLAAQKISYFQLVQQLDSEEDASR